MQSYTHIVDGASKALDAVTPILLFTSRTIGSFGWRLCNPSASQTIYIKCVKSGGSAPSFANMTAGQVSYRVGPYQTVDDGGINVDVYAAVSSGTLTVYPQELF